MAKTETIQVVVDSELNAEVEKVLGEAGMTAAEAIREFYWLVASQKRLPFEVKVPNTVLSHE